MAKRYETGRDPVPFPLAKGIEIQIPKGAEPPELDRAEKQSVRSSVHLLRRLFMARRREAQAKKDATALREKILQRWPLGKVWGVIDRRGKREVSALISDVASQEVSDPTAFVEHLGDKAAEIITGVTVSPVLLEKNPAAYRRLIGFIIEHFGADAVSESLVIQFKASELNTFLADNPLPDGVMVQSDPSWRIIEQKTRPKRQSAA